MLWLTRTYAPAIRISLPPCDTFHCSRRLYSADAYSNNETALSDLSSGQSGTHARQHGNKSLPLSPLLSPEYEAATQRHKQPKPEQAQETLTDFQTELALNPYAQALATNIRQCSLTSARLPRHFLLPFSTRVSRPPHPAENTSTPNKPLAALQPVSYKHGAPETLTTNSYLLNRTDALEQVDRRGHWKILVTERMKQKFALIAQKNHKNLLPKDWWVWRKREMMGVVRLQLEREVVGAVRRVLEWEGGLLLRSVSLNKVDETNDVACTLVLRDTEGASDQARHVQEEAAGQLIPTYNLPTLLSSPENGFVEMLSKHTNPTLTINHHPQTTRMLLRLDRLVAHIESKKLSEDLAEKARLRDEIRSRRSEERQRELEGSLAAERRGMEGYGKAVRKKKHEEESEDEW